MRVVQIGNFGPPHSTENHLKRALEYNGHEVLALQEDSTRLWDHIGEDTAGWSKVDFVLWTRTGWDYTSPEHGRYDSKFEPLFLQQRFLRRMTELMIPTVAYHLDLFFGLNPERVAILDEPFFNCDLVITADGGHQAGFEAKGINHVWFPPGVSLGECEPGMFRDEFRSPIAFVGNWSGDYHHESRHRFELVQWLQQNYARDCAFWPAKGHPRIVGNDLRDLYASVNVVVGDSCLVGTGLANYWSDRIPETLGRGGYLLHPDVPGLADEFDTVEDLTTWTAGHWDGLGTAIEMSLSNPRVCREIAAHGRQTVLDNHTYEVRMEQVVHALRTRALLPPVKPQRIPASRKKVAK